MSAELGIQLMNLIVCLGHGERISRSLNHALIQSQPQLLVMIFGPILILHQDHILREDPCPILEHIRDIPRY